MKMEEEKYSYIIAYILANGYINLKKSRLFLFQGKITNFLG